nr:hypothetical protein [Nocardioides sp.]
MSERTADKATRRRDRAPAGDPTGDTAVRPALKDRIAGALSVAATEHRNNANPQAAPRRT